MKQIWERVEKILSEVAPEIRGRLKPGALASEIEITEKNLGVKFPKNVVELYRMHNGIDEETGFFEGWAWLPLEDIVSQWRIWNDLLENGDFGGISSDADGELVQKDWWNPFWIPLTYDGGGNHHCLDLAPGPKGKIGQIIEMWHDDGPRPVVASSIEEWVEKFAEDLETQKLIYSEDYGLVAP